MPSIYLDTRSDGKRARSRGFSTEIVFALLVAYDVFREHHERVAISCGGDGTHTAGSRHYTGDAVDVRPPKSDFNQGPIVADLRGALGPDYQVIEERAHIHIQYKPFDPLNAEGAAVKA